MVEAKNGTVTSAPGDRIVTVEADGTGPVTVNIHRPDSDGTDLPGLIGSGSAGSTNLSLGSSTGMLGSIAETGSISDLLTTDS